MNERTPEDGPQPDGGYILDDSDVTPTPPPKRLEELPPQPPPPKPPFKKT
jgi:hypothetical protein